MRLVSPATVLMDDDLFARAANLVACTKHVRVMHLFAATLMVILNGEAKEYFSRGDTGRAAYYERVYAKAAAMSVLSTQVAAILGGADGSTMRSLENTPESQFVAALSSMAGCIVRRGRQACNIAQRPDANGMHFPSICLCPPDQYTGAQNPRV